MVGLRTGSSHVRSRGIRTVCETPVCLGGLRSGAPTGRATPPVLRKGGDPDPASG